MAAGTDSHNVEKRLECNIDHWCCSAAAELVLLKGPDHSLDVESLISFKLAACMHDIVSVVESLPVEMPQHIAIVHVVQVVHPATWLGHRAKGLVGLGFEFQWRHGPG